MEEIGLVTEACFPYLSDSEAACRAKCVDSNLPWVKYRCLNGTIAHPLTVDDIKSEIFQNGPVEASLTVFEDFFNYHSGVYQHLAGSIQGSLSVRIIGWGTE